MFEYCQSSYPHSENAVCFAQELNTFIEKMPPLPHLPKQKQKTKPKNNQSRN